VPDGKGCLVLVESGEDPAAEIKRKREKRGPHVFDSSGERLSVHDSAWGALRIRSQI
jgi:hypothetical protein